ncbi:MAG: pyridoxal phosphate-dependent aminotransferase [Desulfotomaculaceae bacterium]|nr:pyridoxal phosphate-dependent aminotransferase [Desulfotomaculaceae bacterium]
MRLSGRALMINPSPTMAIDAKAKAMKASGISVVGFGAGEPDFDTPDHIKEAAVAAIWGGLTKYTPVAGTIELREAICNKFKVDQGLDYQPSQIVVSTGAKHSLYNAIQVLVQAGDEVILPAPYWVSYLEQIKLAGAEAKIVDTQEVNDFKITPEELVSAINQRTRLLILNTPSNPTGAVYSEAELRALKEIIIKHDLTVISDEVYEKIIYDGLRHVSISSISPDLKEHTVVINAVSKTYAMTGWRIGYTAAPASIASAMASLQSHSTSNPTSISQAASVAALSGDQEPVTQMVEEYERRRNYMLERLLAIPGVTCTRPGGAFYLFPDVKSYFGKTFKGKVINCATDLATILLEEIQVALVPGVAFGNDDCFRLSYAVSMDNIKEGMDRMTNLMEKIR